MNVEQWLSPDYKANNISVESSRVDGVRSAQVRVGHTDCFGGVFQRRDGSSQRTPTNCGEGSCPHRRSCIGLQLGDRFNGDRIREESIEYLSRIYYMARAVEHPTPQWTPFQADIAHLVQQWYADTPQVAVLGAFSSGKSTLINRFAGREFLPATRTPTTAVVTSIQYDERAHGVLHYRAAARLLLLSGDARSPDPGAIQALRSWMTNPEKYGVISVQEVDDKGSPHEVKILDLLEELDDLENIVRSRRDKTADKQKARRGVLVIHRRIGKRLELPVSRLARTFEVFFKEQSPVDIDLTNAEGISEFGRHLTDPSCALRLHRATCYLPSPGLRVFNLLDTAGLCSPVPFHTGVTIELLKRRPDKILVLLDSRRLDSPTNGEALHVLRRFIKVPEDYRHVTFALTFWDLALRTHMQEDSEPELDFNSVTEREETAKRFAKSKRDELIGLLSSIVGVECQNNHPMVFFLGLGLQAPPEMAESLDDIWSHLINDCGGWLSVEMWTERWRTPLEFADRLVQLHQDVKLGIEESIRKAKEKTGLETELSLIAARERQIIKAFERAKESMLDVIEAQKKRMLAEIRMLDSKKEILSYIDSKYFESVKISYKKIKEESISQNEAFKELIPNARTLSHIEIDLNILGLDDDFRKDAKSHVEGVIYGIKWVWDFIFGSLYELGDTNRAAVRSILNNKTQGTIDLFKIEVNRWIKQASRIRDQVLADISKEKESIGARSANKSEYIKKQQNELDILVAQHSSIKDLWGDIRRFASDLDLARNRIVSSRNRNYRMVLRIDNRDVSFRKGREQGRWFLPYAQKGRWRWLEIRSGDKISRYFPVASGDGGKSVAFVENQVRSDAFIVPQGKNRFELNLASLEGEFIEVKKDFRNRRKEQFVSSISVNI